ncbi:hypothetical protein F5Y14DRAFT_430119 [Nemania sp. NC0429]|nr:hypothetical protein F5Y14DRAFT_430119 [Nemania sp. NC0429]
MDPISIATAVITTFEVVYLTTRFIYREVLRVKGFHDGKAKMARNYRIQIVRLNVFWTLIVRNGKMKTGTDEFKGLSEQLYNCIYGILLDIGTTLNTYSRLARELDEEYQNYHTKRLELPSGAEIVAIKLPLGLDDAIEPTPEELEAERDASNEPQPPVPDVIARPKPGGFFGSILNRGGRKEKEREKEKDPAKTSQFRVRELPDGIAWCFQERQLKKSLKTLKENVNDLYGFSPFLIMDIDLGGAIGPKASTARAFGEIKVHKQLQTIAEKHGTGLQSADTDIAPIAWSTMKGYIVGSEQPSSRILVERKETGNFPREGIAAPTVEEAEAEAEHAPLLASQLASSSQEGLERTALGTLPFRGFSKDATVPNGCFYFAFDYPEAAAGRKPVSLQELIRSGEARYRLSLNDRFNVAKVVARCLGTLHSDGWLHKSVRSQAIKFFFGKADDDDDEFAALDTSAPYLTDFGFSRPLGGFSVVRSPPASTAVNLDMDVYRHPRRFGHPSQYFNKVHDVYSLGVVLLEIGIWKTAKQMYEEAFGPAKQDPTGEEVKRAFVERAEGELEHSMGSAYRDAVLLCLDGKALTKHLGKASFAIEFQKNVVRKVDVARLNPEGADFDDTEPPRYEDIVSS